MVCHCVLLDCNGRLVLIDTGLSVADLSNPRRLGIMGSVLGLKGHPRQAAIRQIEQLGYAPDAVEHIVLTHLDLDHASGLVDFPSAKVHVLRKEYEAATQPNTLGERLRYRAYHWKHQPKWVLYDDAVLPDFVGRKFISLEGLPISIDLVPLHGHTRGHCGVLFQGHETSILHCGDAYYARKELAHRPTMLYTLFQQAANVDVKETRASRSILAQMISDNPSMRCISSHDPTEFVYPHIAEENL